MYLERVGPINVEVQRRILRARPMHGRTAGEVHSPAGTVAAIDVGFFPVRARKCSSSWFGTTDMAAPHCMRHLVRPYLECWIAARIFASAKATPLPREVVHAVPAEDETRYMCTKKMN